MHLKWTFAVYVEAAASFGEEWGEWRNGLEYYERIRRILVQSPLNAWPVLRVQPRWESPGELWVDNWHKQRWLISG